MFLLVHEFSVGERTYLRIRIYKNLYHLRESLLFEAKSRFFSTLTKKKNKTIADLSVTTGESKNSDQTKTQSSN